MWNLTRTASVAAMIPFGILAGMILSALPLNLAVYAAGTGALALKATRLGFLVPGAALGGLMAALVAAV